MTFENGVGQGGIGPFLLELEMTDSFANHLAGTDLRPAR